MDPEMREVLGKANADRKSIETVLENKQKELIGRLKDLTESGAMQWRHTADFGPRSYCADFKGVRFELRVNNQILCFNSQEILDSQGWLDELAWAVEAQFASRSPHRRTAQEELQDVLDKLNAQ